LIEEIIITFLTKAVVVFVIGAIIFSIMAAVYFIRRSYNVGDIIQVIEKNGGETLINNGKVSLITLNEGAEKLGVAFVEKETGAVLFNQVFDLKNGVLDEREHFYVPRPYRKDLKKIIDKELG